MASNTSNDCMKAKILCNEKLFIGNGVYCLQDVLNVVEQLTYWCIIFTVVLNISVQEL